MFWLLQIYNYFFNTKPFSTKKIHSNAVDFFVLQQQTLSYQNFLHVAAHAYDVESCGECDFRAVGKRCRCHLAA